MHQVEANLLYLCTYCLVYIRSSSRQKCYVFVPLSPFTRYAKRMLLLLMVVLFVDAVMILPLFISCVLDADGGCCTPPEQLRSPFFCRCCLLSFSLSLAHSLSLYVCICLCVYQKVRALHVFYTICDGTMKFFL